MVKRLLNRSGSRNGGEMRSSLSAARGTVKHVRRYFWIRSGSLIY